MASIIDSNSEAGYSGDLNIQDNHPSDAPGLNSAGGEAFTIPTSAKTITGAKFYLKKSGSPTGNATFQVYAATGTIGTNATPTGAALGTSGNLDLTTVTTSFALYELTFGTPIDVTGGSDYCVVMVNPASGVDSGNYPIVGYTGNTHAGNLTHFWNTAWASNSSLDVAFYLYGTITTGGSFLLNFV